ncbi:MAG TPA: (Fe-S)-binding protein, partial [Aquella sp.]|nr:(Fe-S)-binding protein [Aquella sp.]
PGKLAAPKLETKLDRIELVPMRGEFDQIISEQNQKDFVGSMLCNGNGACFNNEPANVMCPSYKVTRDRIHSPKGRAMLVKQWLRESSRPESNDLQTRQVADLAYIALNGCLGCKGCTGKCPTQVSIPDLKTKFLDNYHRKYKRRSLRDLALGYIENLLPIFARFPRIWNFVHRFKLVPTFGLKNVPLFKSKISLIKQLKKLDVQIYSTPEQIKNMTKNSVVIFADAFTGLLDVDVLIATLNLLKNMGYTPYVIYPRTSGKSLIVGGFIDKFKSNTEKLAKLFNPLFAANIPIIGIENTITLMFREEVKRFATSFDGQVSTLAEFLNQNLDKLHTLYDNIKRHVSQLPNKQKYKLLPHCTEQAILPGEAILWQNIFNKLNIELGVQNTGCCGMAGAYGYQQEHAENSKNLFAMHWQQTLSDNSAEVLATGFSCRCQVQKQISKTVVHPVQILAT